MTGTLEVEQDGEVVTKTQLVTQGIQDYFTFGCETSQDQYGLSRKGINTNSVWW